MSAGKVWMNFDDGTSGWVPAGRVKEAQADGGVIAPRVKMKVNLAGGPVVREFSGARVPLNWQERGEVMEPGDTTQNTPVGRAFANMARELPRRFTTEALPSMATVATGGALSHPAIQALHPAVRALAATTGFGASGGATQGARELAYRATGAGDAPGTIEDAAKQQAILAAGGETGAAALEGLGLPFMMWAQSNRGGVPMKEAVQRARAAITERIPVGKNPLRPNDVAGSERAVQLRGERDIAARQEAEAVSKYGAEVGPGVHSGQGIKFNMNRVSPRLRALVNQADRIPGYGSQAKRLRRIVNEMMEKHGNRDLALDQVRGLRQDMDAISEVVKGALPKGVNPKSLSPVKRAWDAFSNDFRDVLRAPEVGPSISRAEKGVQSAILAEKGARAGEKGLSFAASRGVPIAAGTAASVFHPGPIMSELPQVLGAGAAASALTQPWVASRLALGMTNPYLLALLRRGPVLAGAANQPRE